MPLFVHQTVSLVLVQDGHLAGRGGLEGGLAVMAADAGDDAVHALPSLFVERVLLMRSSLFWGEAHFHRH